MKFKIIFMFIFLQFVFSKEKLFKEKMENNKYYWNTITSRLIILELTFTFILYTILYGYDLFKKKNILEKETGKEENSKEIEINSQKKNKERKIEMKIENDKIGLKEIGIINKENSIENKKVDEYNNIIINNNDKNNLDEDEIKNKISLHYYFFNIMITHALIVGFIITGGYHGVSLVIFTWLHLFYFLAYLFYFYTRCIKGFEKFENLFIFPFFIFNFIPLVISLSKIK